MDEQFLIDVNNYQLRDKAVPSEVKAVKLQELKDRYLAIRSKCNSDEDANQELLRSLGITSFGKSTNS